MSSGLFFYVASVAGFTSGVVVSPMFLDDGEADEVARLVRLVREFGWGGVDE